MRCDVDTFGIQSSKCSKQKKNKAAKKGLGGKEASFGVLFALGTMNAKLEEGTGSIMLRNWEKTERRHKAEQIGGGWEAGLWLCGRCC